MALAVSDLLKAGFSDAKAAETLKNKGLSSSLSEAFADLRVEGGELDPTIGKLIYSTVSKLKAQIIPHRRMLISLIAKGKLNRDVQVNAAISYLLSNPVLPTNEKAFNDACGIGVVVTPEQIDLTLRQIFEKFEVELREQRYRFSTGRILGEANKTALKWADALQVRSEIDVQMIDLLGPKTEEDLTKPTKKKSTPSSDAVPTSASSAEPMNGDVAPSSKPGDDVDVHDFLKGDRGVSGFTKYMSGEMRKFHKPGENYKTDGYVVTKNTMRHMKDHLEKTGGTIQTRFPPEPNGILHIGHAKAINFDFGYARLHNGRCYLRYDDTNPEKEEQRFVDAIEEMVRWLGYAPWKVTHASDNFAQLHAYAVQLIRNDLAYICHQTADELKGQNPPPSPWRDRPMEDSLRLFEDMRCGKIAEGDATLRMKHTLADGKQDPVAYRIKFAPHPHSGDTWCIYPTYDFTHCLCDSIEQISHSLCTKEFQARRPSYYWLCNALDVYCPVQWEYGRLNLEYTVVSKRKIGRLISADIVKDWDDPRLFTLTALRRRGCPPEAINYFCARVGVTMSQTLLDPAMLDACLRDVLNLTAPRAMAALQPIRVRITNFNDLKLSDGSKMADGRWRLSVPDFPADDNSQTHSVLFGGTVFIDASDFRAPGSAIEKGYKRWTEAQPVGLKHAGVVLRLKRVVASTELEAEASVVGSAGEKAKCFIQWVSESDCVRADVRVYASLFLHKNPEGVVGGYEAAVNPDSLRIFDAVVDRSVVGAERYARFQFERLGYFAIDDDSSDSKLVFNRTVSLRDAKGKEG